MATSKEYKDFILEQLDLLDNISCKSMMGEFLLYYNEVLFGGIYDNRLLVKKVESNKKYNVKEDIPYESYKTLGSTKYYRYRDKVFIWKLTSRNYYTSTGIKNKASAVTEYYRTTPNSNYKL